MTQNLSDAQVRREADDVPAGLKLPDPVDSKKAFRGSRRALFGDSYRASEISGLISRYAEIRSDYSLVSVGHGRPGGNCVEIHGDPGPMRDKIAVADGRESVVDRAELAGSPASSCIDTLNAVKGELERRRSNLELCTRLLGLAQRELVSRYSSQVLGYRLNAIRVDLEAMQPVPQAQLDRLDWVMNRLKASTNAADHEQLARTALKDALAYIDEVRVNEQIEEDLQVARLRLLLTYLLISWFVLVPVIPVVSAVRRSATSPSGALAWPVWSTGFGDYLDLLVASVALSVVGAVGGVVSGMLSVRDSRAVLGKYRTSVLRILLKPVAGAIAALTMYLFLSVDLISGVQVTTTGVYIVAAFVAGFSERYFLKFLRIRETEQSNKEAHDAKGQVQRSGPRTMSPAA